VEGVAIVNRLVVEGTAAGILALSAQPEIARVLPEWSSSPGLAGPAGLAAPQTSPPPALGERFRSWALEATRASTLWAQGIDGRGVVVAALDTGADGGHEQLRGRRLPGSRGWFDPEGTGSEPYDPHGHGTSVLSLAVGGGVPVRVIGVAPGARWAAGLANAGNQYSRVRMTRAADWVLRVARPDVLVNAWSHAEGPCPAFDLPFLDAWRAAEIFVVFPAGNAGPEPRSGESPGQLPGAFAVAGLTPEGAPLPESSRGPSACGDHLFPSLAAPGAELPFAFPSAEHAYGQGDGTSLAAGVVAGAAALLLHALPDLTPQELEAALLVSARDVPPGGRDPITGAGALDLEAALAAARRRSVREGDRAVGVHP
jgi:subtilisin family serine protease